MKAIVFDETPQVMDMPKPDPGEGEALIRVLMAGVCNTDLEILKGYMGFTGILGHEFVGIVEEGPDEFVGKRVAGEINCSCGVCDYCLGGMSTHCPHRTVLGIQGRHGAFAEYTTLPVENLHVIPDAMRDDVAVFVEPTAAAFRILEQVELHEDERVIVQGDGKLGQLIAQVLWHRCRNLTVIGRQAWKRNLLEGLGINTVAADDAIEPGADMVVEVTGSVAGLARAFELARPMGTVVLKTTVAGATPAPMALPVINELTILGSRCGPFPPAIEALALGNVTVGQLITEVHPIDDGPAALERAAAKDVMKVLISLP